MGVPTGTNLLGLVNHLVDSEMWWFHHHVDGGPWDGDFEHDMEVGDSVSAAEVVKAYRDAWARSNEIIRVVDDPTPSRSYRSTVNGCPCGGCSAT